MKYQSVEDLPESIHKTYPGGAREIYMEAFNNSWDENGHHHDHAHAAGATAVEQAYFYNEETNKWRKK